MTALGSPRSGEGWDDAPGLAAQPISSSAPQQQRQGGTEESACRDGLVVARTGLTENNEN